MIGRRRVLLTAGVICIFILGLAATAELLRVPRTSVLSLEISKFILTDRFCSLRKSLIVNGELRSLKGNQ